MKRAIPIFAQLVLLLIAALILLRGVWLLAAVIEQRLLIDDQLFTWIDFLLIVSVLLILYFVAYVGKAIGLWGSLLQWVKSVVHRLRRGNPVSASAVPMTVMRLSYKLEDPRYQIEFNRFLDTPVFTDASKKQVVTPAQLVERRVHQLSREITASYGSKLVVQPSIIRGSLEVAFDLIGTTWNILKDYKDLVEIAAILSSQTQTIVNIVNKTYKKKYGREFVVSRKVETNEESTIQGNADLPNAQTQSSSSTPPPVNITNSYIPPQNNRDMHISINTSGRGSCIGGCISSCLLVLLLIALVVASFLFLFVDYEERLALLQEVVNYVGYSMRVVARWMLQWANTIAPTFTEFY